MSRFLIYSTLAPSLVRLFITAETERSFPGIGEAEMITVSPFFIDMDLCSPREIRARAEYSSPCEPVVKITTLLSGSFRAASARSVVFGGIFRIAKLKAISTAATIDRPVTTTFRSYLWAELNTCWKRLIGEEKVAKIDRK